MRTRLIFPSFSTLLLLVLLFVAFPTSFVSENTGSVPGLLLAQQQQQTDPFYLRLFRPGEQSFFVGRYKEGAKDLEAALFGLYGEKELQEKAYVYLGPAYYYVPFLPTFFPYWLNPAPGLAAKIFNIVRSH